MTLVITLTWTGLVWPIRWHRAWACKSFWGFQSLSKIIHVSAAYGKYRDCVSVTSSTASIVTYRQVDTHTTSPSTQQKDKGFFNWQGREAINSSLTLVTGDWAINTFISILSSFEVVRQDIQAAIHTNIPYKRMRIGPSILLCWFYLVNWEKINTLWFPRISFFKSLSIST